MPGSAPDFREQIVRYVRARHAVTAIALDIGAGEGTWGKLLNPWFSAIDAIEIHQPYIWFFNLGKIYRKVYCVDCVDFEYEQYYDLIMAGAVIEHLTVARAQQFFEKVLPMCTTLVVTVPYETPQGAVGGVESERHLQPDLTPERMQLRYPYLTPLWTNNKRGVYIRNLSYVKSYF